MSGIDLHTHSVYSDGTYTPAEIVNCAKEKGLSVISLTDHDTIDGLDEAGTQAASLGIRFINGVEINSCCCVDDKKINIHVLGYSFIPDDIKDYMTKLKEMRAEHNIAILNALHAIGIEIDYVELEKQSSKGTITRLNIARTLVQKGYAESVKDALHRYLHKEGTAYVEYQNQPFSIVAKKIHDAGGVVSLAHPAEYELSDIETERLVRCLQECGLDAVECIHPKHSVAYSQKIIHIANQYNLLLTGGSDFHGKNDDGIELGMGGDKMLIPESLFNRDISHKLF